MERLAWAAILLAGLAGCDDRAPEKGDGGYGGNEVGDDDDGTVLPGDDDDDGVAAAQGRIVYAMTNAAEGNAIVGLEHDARGGELFEFGRFETRGMGTGTAELPKLTVDDGIDPLVSQGSIHRAGGHLLAVNAGSGSVTVFRAEDDGGLVVTDVEDVGAYPNTIASFEDRVFVGLSAGPDARAGVAVLRLSDDGQLTADGDVLPLATGASHPADLLVTEDGKFLVASELLDDSLAVWPLREDGRIGEVVRTPSAGPGPFGMDSVGDVLIVSEAAPMVPNGSSASSYRIEPDGSLTELTPVVPTKQTAACWLEITPDGEHAIVSNTESGTLSTFRIGADTGLELVRGAARSPGDAPIDLSISGDGRFLYVLLGEVGEVAVYRLADRVRFSTRTDALELPSAGVQGILAW